MILTEIVRADNYNHDLQFLVNLRGLETPDPLDANDGVGGSAEWRLYRLVLELDSSFRVVRAEAPANPDALPSGKTGTLRGWAPLA